MCYVCGSLKLLPFPHAASDLMAITTTCSTFIWNMPIFRQQMFECLFVCHELYGVLEEQLWKNPWPQGTYSRGRRGKKRFVLIKSYSRRCSVCHASIIETRFIYVRQSQLPPCPNPRRMLVFAYSGLPPPHYSQEVLSLPVLIMNFCTSNSREWVECKKVWRKRGQRLFSRLFPVFIITKNPWAKEKEHVRKKKV